MEYRLRCGAAKANITPGPELMKRLHGLRNVHFVQVLDELFVRVIAFDNGVQRMLIVSFELDKSPVPDAFSTELSQRTGVPKEYIFYLSTHTHTAPIHSERPNDGPNAKFRKPEDVQKAMSEYEQLLKAKLFDAADEALADLEECRIGWTLGESYINENRCRDYYVEAEDGTVTAMCALGSNPTGPVDRELTLIRAERMDGSTIAAFVNYPVHCCIMIGNNWDGQGGAGLGGDLAGAVSRMMEEKYGGIAVWTSGAAGDVNPIMLNEYYIPDPKTGAMREYLDVNSAQPALTALKLLSTRHFDDIKRAMRKLRCEIQCAEISAATDWSHTPAKGGGTYDIRVRCVRLGELLFCGISGELYTTHGRRMRAAAGKAQNPPAHMIIMNHDGSLDANCDYISDDETLARYEHNDENHGMPGMGPRTCILPGYVAKSLEELTVRLLDRC